MEKGDLKLTKWGGFW